MIAWIDLETTGLNPLTQDIIEVGLVITDDDLTVVASDSWLVTPSISDERWDAVALEMHRRSGLYDLVQKDSLNAKKVAMEVRALMGTYAEPMPMGGSSVHFDRAFLQFKMPDALEYFSHRCIDVSTLKELSRRWDADNAYPQTPDADKAHRSLDDLHATLRELAYYRHLYFT